MSRSDGQITITCDWCRESTVVVSVSGLVRGKDNTPVSGLTIYPPLEKYGWVFVDGEGDVCPDCQTPREKHAVEVYHAD